MIKNCFMDEQPNFLKEVSVDGVKIATVKALSRNDRAEIEEKSATKELKNGEIVVKFNFQKMQLVRMKCALSGKGSWEFDRDVNEENVGLLPESYFDAIDQAIQEMDSFNKEEIEKNLKQQSD